MSKLLSRLGRLRIGAIALAVALCSTASLTACGSDNEWHRRPGGGAETVTMWTLEDVQSRIDATKKIAAEYTAKTGIPVEVVAVAEDQFPQLITSAAAADKLPDVIAAVGLATVQDLAAKELLDTGRGRRGGGRARHRTPSPSGRWS